MDLNCFYCKNTNANILKPIPIIQESFFKRMSYNWVCSNCNKKYCEYLGEIKNESL